MNEKDYERGYRMASRSMLSKALEGLEYKGNEAEHSKWIIEREMIVSALREICEEFGDNDWEPSLGLSYVIEKHLHNYIRDRKFEVVKEPSIVHKVIVKGKINI